MNQQPPAAPITPEEIAALRDVLSKATPGEWFSWYVAASEISGSHPACGTRFGRVQGPQMVQLDKSEAYTPHDAAFTALAHNLAPKLLAALDAAEQRAALAQQQAAGYQAAIKREADMCAAATAAEAKAMEFAWELLGLSERDGELYDDCKASLPRKAAEYLAERGLLRKVGERTWQRVEER